MATSSLPCVRVGLASKVPLSASVKSKEGGWRDVRTVSVQGSGVVKRAWHVATHTGLQAQCLCPGDGVLVSLVRRLKVRADAGPSLGRRTPSRCSCRTCSSRAPRTVLPSAAPRSSGESPVIPASWLVVMGLEEVADGGIEDIGVHAGQGSGEGGGHRRLVGAAVGDFEGGEDAGALAASPADHAAQHGAGNQAQEPRWRQRSSTPRCPCGPGTHRSTWTWWTR